MNEKTLANEFADQIEGMTGKYEGSRRAHANGFAAMGTFTPTNEAANYSKASIFQQPSKVLVRFSNAIPIPDVSDVLSVVKGMAVQFQTDEPKLSMAFANSPLFITKTPEEFYDLLRAIKPADTTERPSMKRMYEILMKHEAGKAAMEIIKQVTWTRNYTSTAYWGIHTFFLVNESGTKTPVKFSFEPTAGVEKLTPSEAKDLKQHEMEQEDRQKIRNEAVTYEWIAQIGTADDPIDDSTKLWPEERERLVLGTFTINELTSTEDVDTIFDPTNLIEGIEPSNDPVFHFRNAMYGESYTRRTQEKHV